MAMKNAVRGALLVTALGLGAAGCTLSETMTHGYQLDEDALALVPEGASREQVLLTLGTPSTTQTLSGEESFYYISQTKKRNVSFARAKVIDQRVLAIYFDGDEQVQRIGNYGLKDGKVFDFRRRITPTGGKDTTFLAQILSGATGAPNATGKNQSIFGG